MIQSLPTRPTRPIQPARPSIQGASHPGSADSFEASLFHKSRPLVLYGWMMTARLSRYEQPLDLGVPSFAELIDRHQHEIMRYLLRLAGSVTDADDLFQETFMRAFLAYRKLELSANHRPWLYRIATNVFLNHRRDRVRHPEVALEDTISASQLKTESNEISDRTESLHRWIVRLPPRQRSALVQRKLQGLGYGEIAVALRCSEQTARAHVYQAIRKLRRWARDDERRVSTSG